MIGNIRTDFPSREYNLVLVAVSADADGGLDFEEVDAFQQGTARLEESPEMGVDVSGSLRARVLGGLGGLLGLLFHDFVGVHRVLGGLHGCLERCDKSRDECCRVGCCEWIAMLMFMRGGAVDESDFITRAKTPRSRTKRWPRTQRTALKGCITTRLPFAMSKRKNCTETKQNQLLASSDA